MPYVHTAEFEALVRGRSAPLTPGLDRTFRIGPGVTRAAEAKPYARRPDDPLTRPLRIYTLDPSASKLDGCVTVAAVPYEQVEPGPIGAMLAVEDVDGQLGQRYAPIDLDDPRILINQGRDASAADPRFHQQMVYAVCSQIVTAFRRALGRHLAWGFDSATTGSPFGHRLLIRPHAFLGENAYYDEATGELRFGYYRAARQSAGRNLPDSFVFTCLSHDVVAHEVTHALLDGLRAEFTAPTGPDVLAFHEALADCVALFQRFTYADVVRSALRRARGDVGSADLLTDVARQFGDTTGRRSALRTAIDAREGKDPPPYDASVEPHDRGASLVAAVFEAFGTIFRRRTERAVRLATGGTGVIPPGELPADLLDALSESASSIAAQFLRICVRAIDYCPPVDLEFGEFLRAVITADHDLVPDDPWAYREAWIDAFRRRAIYPRFVPNLSEDALRWGGPETELPSIPALAFAALQFDGDPACPADEHELARQATALGTFVTDARWIDEFGLVLPGDRRLGDDDVELPVVQSIRSSRRAGPDGEVVFDLVAEVTQRRLVRDGSGGSFDFLGGATVIIGPDGRVRYVIRKSVLNESRLERQRQFIRGEGRRFWGLSAERWMARPTLFGLLHRSEE